VNIWVVRHGRTEANASGLLLGRADPSLDATGRQQAARLAEYLPAATIVTSPLQRCVETAQIIAAGAGAPIEPRVDERLIELDYGQWDLTPLQEVPAGSWAQWRADDDFRPPGGESLTELSGRVSQLLDEMAQRSTEIDDVVMVTHVSPIKAAMAWALGVGIAVSWRSHVVPASITSIHVSERGPSLRGFNWQP